MKVEGTYTFKADIETVWNSLLDPNVLSDCLPGCEKFESIGDETYEVVLKEGVSAVSGTYTGKVTVTDKQYRDSYRMLVEGKGSGGTIRGEGVLSFSGDEHETEISVVGDAQVSGIIARVGQRLLGGVSKSIMNQFFGCLKAKIEGL